MDPVERLKIKISVIDIALKTLIAFGLLLLSGIQLYDNSARLSQSAEDSRQRDLFNKQSSCWTAMKDSINIILEYSLSREKISAMNALLPKPCADEKRDQLASLVEQISKSPTPTKTAPPPTTDANSDNRANDQWAAIGFVGTSDFSFRQPNGAVLTAAPKPDQIIQARWPVNIRPGPADWSSIKWILPEGECFKVSAVPAPLKAGRVEQIWASGVRWPCS